MKPDFTSALPRKLVVEIDSSLPEDLFGPRRINSTLDIDRRFWIGGTLGLLVSDLSIIPRILAGGAEHGPSGVFIRYGSRIDFNVLDEFLPLVGRQVITPLLGDLIPPTSWGSSLFNLLTPGCWELLRAQTFAKTGGHCEICGSTRQLECHESWEYHEPIPDHLAKGGVGVQRLVRLMALCSECHDTQHLGLANVKRIFPKVIDRVRSYNRWTASEGSRYWDFLEARSRRRSRCLWALDLSGMAETPLMVKGNWQMGSDGWLSAKTETGESTTLIFGAGWRRGDVSYPAMSTDAGYYE